jgi:hypothetical protein
MDASMLYGTDQCDLRKAAIVALQRMVAALKARVAQLEQPTAQWLPLKAAAHDAGVKYETTRVRAERGPIEARRDGKRWYVNLISLVARKQRLAGLGSEPDQYC